MTLLLSFLVPGPVIPYVSVLCGSYFAIGSMWDAIKRRELDVNFLMVFAAVGAIAVGRPTEAAGLLFLFSLSSTLESYAMARTKSAIEGLVKLRPDKALRVTASGEERVPVEDLVVGDRVIVPPFEHIPSDGVVAAGSGSVNQSAMTGESQPVPKMHGDSLIGGTQNLESVLEMTVTTTISDSTLTKIVNLVEDAQTNKASGERISTWFGQRYTWFVLAAFAASIAFHMGFPPEPLVAPYNTPWDYALYKSLTLLVALSPCALVISTPATTLSALATAARRGILVRGGRYVELAGEIRAIALDKTGTLTTGRPELAEICLCATATAGGDRDACWSRGTEMSERALEVLSIASAVEQYSNHPLAEAIVRAAHEHDLAIPEAEDRQTLPGLGVSASIGGKKVAIGQRRLIERLDLHPDEAFMASADAMASKGMSVALLSYGGKFAALGLRDAPRANAVSVLGRLKSLGVAKAVMITGDNRQTAEAVAAEIGITDVRAGLLPDQKEGYIGELIDQEGSTMMVGDGVNDAPSLAKATVGVAMGGLGSDIALNAADVVLMHDDLDRIPELVELGRRTNRIVKANLTFATAVIVSLAAASLISILPLPIAVVGHEGSTVLVILNGLRLLKLKEPGTIVEREPG